jgi:hypothetical protein
MKVSGFTFIRNAILYDYPVTEAIQSVLPLCDEFVVALGQSEDETEALIRSINSPQVRIINTVWDDTLRKGGQVLALETDKAFKAIDPESTWAFYIQADEVLHEQYLPVIRASLERYRNEHQVEGLLLNYLHFYGSYDFTGDSPKWYRREIRVVRNLPGIRSWKDAQGFRIDRRKLKVKPVDAWIYHYGWVKPPALQQLKQLNFNKYWHDDDWIEDRIPQIQEFDYGRIDALRHFTGTHPRIMLERISKMNWHFSFDPTLKKLSIRHRLLHLIEKLTGWRPGEYRNYRILR